MILFRMVYVRAGKPRGTTFAAASPQAAAKLAEKWVAGFGGRLLTVNRASTDRHARRMAAWRAAKSDRGRRGWKAAKKKIKRLMRDDRRAARQAQNAPTDGRLSE